MKLFFFTLFASIAILRWFLILSLFDVESILLRWCVFFVVVLQLALVCIRFYSLRKTLHQFGISFGAALQIQAHISWKYAISLRIVYSTFFFITFYSNSCSRFEYFLLCSWLFVRSSFSHSWSWFLTPFLSILYCFLTYTICDFACKSNI